MPIDTHFDETKGRPAPSSPRADVIRPIIATYFNQALAAETAAARATLEVQDYIVQKATAYALLWPENHLHERFSQIEVGKQWMLGFLDWYTLAANQTRNQDASQLADNALWRKGILLMARRKYRLIAWDEAYINSADSLWMAPGITDAMLDRVDRFMDRCTVQSWHVIRGAFGNVRMPKQVTYTGMPLILGWEITHDWILPKDANHGIGILTITFILREIKKLLNVGHSTQKDSRARSDGFVIKSGGLDYVVSIGSEDGAIITCYKKT